METIKLVIWDMDDTFWSGTLSEGDVTILDEPIQVVKELVNRGIMNSISSKNDFEPVKEKLSEIGVWSDFVFPHISWEPKGQQVQSIIQLMQLRPVNVLFIDDNHLNIEEVKFYNKGIQTAMPEFITKMLKHPSFKGKDDSQHSRLKQYQLLERKNTAQKKYSNNLEFLKSSNIRLSFITDLSGNKKRLAELIERTNQLNFTKARLDENELDQLISNNRIEKALVHVQDRFGDYGIVGFYALDRSKNKLLHFLFSCRILNLGVEQFIYAKIGFPELTIVGDVISSLNRQDQPDWITLADEGLPKPADKAVFTDVSGKERVKVFFKGGCDLSQMLFYVRGNFEITEEINYVMKNNMPIQYEHTDIILQTYDHKLPTEKPLPFLDKGIFQTKLFDFGYDVLLFSVLMDYTQYEYRHKSGYILPHRGYLDITKDENKEKILSSYRRDKVKDYDAAFLKKFKKEYQCLGWISPQRFVENLIRIRKIVPQNIPIIFINGSEQDVPNADEPGAQQRHIEMNRALDGFIAAHENCYLLDVREIVTTPDFHTNNIRHYTRMVYVQMAEELKTILYDLFKSQRIRKKQSLFRNLIKGNDTLYKYLVTYPDKAKSKINRLKR